MRLWAALALAVATTPCFAAESVVCGIAYATSEGWTRESRVLVTFLTAPELVPPPANSRGIFVDIGQPGMLAEIEGRSAATSYFYRAMIPQVFIGGNPVVANTIEGASRRLRINCLGPDRRWMDPKLR